MDGTLPEAGPVVIYDDEQAYMGGVIADHLAATCPDITFVTPAGTVSPWTVHTLEQERIQASLISQDVPLQVSRKVVVAHEGEVETACVFTGRASRIPCSTLVLVTERLPVSGLADALRGSMSAQPDTALRTVRTIGDALAPGLIADAVFAGHLAARDFQRDPLLVEQELFQREIPVLGGSIGGGSQ
jgi:dimethylamine/trimethylamine dehydrogenase